jgi:hypothetical protein
MNRKLKYTLLSLIAFSMIVVSCKPKSDNSQFSQNATTETKTSELIQDEEDIKATINTLLAHAGNYNIIALDSMMSDKAMLGISNFRDGTWSNSEIAIYDFFESVKNREPSPYCEIPNNYDILITEGQVAIARADCILSRWGIPLTREVNHFTFIKEDGKWKILNITWTNIRVPEDQKVFDLGIFARGYAQAWCSKRPNFVSSFFAEDGELTVNKGETAKGTNAISDVAKGFMEAFPDMIVSLDSLTTKSDKTLFYWTLTGTDKGTNGSGNRVKISGFEEWTLNDKGLIQKSIGYFDEIEYKRHLELGTDR